MFAGSAFQAFLNTFVKKQLVKKVVQLNTYTCGSQTNGRTEGLSVDNGIFTFYKNAKNIDYTYSLLIFNFLKIHFVKN